MVPRAGGEARGDRPILRGGWTVEEAGRKAGDVCTAQKGSDGPVGSHGGWLRPSE